MSEKAARWKHKPCGTVLLFELAPGYEYNDWRAYCPTCDEMVNTSWEIVPAPSFLDAPKEGAE